MQQVNQEYLNRIKGRYTEKYATVMDDWTAIILHEVSENISALSKANGSQMENGIKEIHNASKLIKGQINRVQFASNKEAFLFGLGQNLLYGISMLLIAIMVFWIYTTSADFQNKLDFVESHPEVERFESIYTKGLTITKDGYEFLIVYPAKGGNVEFARNYLYDKENVRVLIPIGTK